MKIGIHHDKGSFSEDWIRYCRNHNIEYKIVNAYGQTIIEDLEDCDVFMWHFTQINPKDMLFARQLLFSLEQSGKPVYPNWKTSWSFDDKLGQKYLFEAFKMPLIKSYAFYSKSDALKWAESYKFPAVFKLRGGAGSYNVMLARTKAEAIKYINKCFGSGFRQYNPITDIQEAFAHFLKRKATLKDVLKAVLHIVVPYQIEKSKGREKGYAYFQEFITGCNSDIRIQVVDDKCYAMRRFVRKNDFRASGSGMIDFDGSKIPQTLIKKSFDLTKSLGVQSLAIDWLETNNDYVIAEISYAWGIAEGELDCGYWNDKLVWIPEKVDLGEWFVQLMMKNNQQK
jgi:glutathione synthase/RimK-type ligase-like ATP-grasp enzyme